MKPKTTGIWFVLAASLFAFIWIYEKYLQPAAPTADIGSPKSLAVDMFTGWLYPFEATSVLLLVAMVGVIVLAKRRL